MLSYLDNNSNTNSNSNSNSNDNNKNNNNTHNNNNGTPSLLPLITETRQLLPPVEFMKNLQKNPREADQYRLDEREFFSVDDLKALDNEG